MPRRPAHRLARAVMCKLPHRSTPATDRRPARAHAECRLPRTTSARYRRDRRCAAAATAGVVRARSVSPPRGPRPPPRPPSRARSSRRRRAGAGARRSPRPRRARRASLSASTTTCATPRCERRAKRSPRARRRARRRDRRRPSAPLSRAMTAGIDDSAPGPSGSRANSVAASEPIAEPLTARSRVTRPAAGIAATTNAPRAPSASSAASSSAPRWPRSAVSIFFSESGARHALDGPPHARRRRRWREAPSTGCSRTSTLVVRVGGSDGGVVDVAHDTHRHARRGERRPRRRTRRSGRRR